MTDHREPETRAALEGSESPRVTVDICGGVPSDRDRETIAKHAKDLIDREGSESPQEPTEA